MEKIYIWQLNTFELTSGTPEKPFVSGRRTEVYEEDSHHVAFAIRYLAVEKYEIILDDNQLIAVHCHPRRYVFSKNGHEIATMKRVNRCRTISDDQQVNGELDLEGTYGSWMSNLEILAVLTFPVIGYRL